MQPSGYFSADYGKDMAVVRTRAQWFILIAFMLALIYFPFWAGAGGRSWEGVLSVSLAIDIGITLIAVLGLCIVSGLCGQINFGQPAFMAMGAYVSGILSTRWDLPFPLAIVSAGLLAAVFGLVFGLPALRLKGLYLVVATFAAMMIVPYVINHTKSLTGGSDGLRVPEASIAGFGFDSDIRKYFLVLFFAVLAVIVAKNISRSRVGRAFVGIRDNDIAAAATGVNIAHYKLLAFFIGCFFAGIAGSLWAHHVTFIHAEQFQIWDAIWMLGMLIIGGWGSVAGTVLGVVFLKGLGELGTVLSPRISEWAPSIPERVFAALTSQVAFGLAIIVFIMLAPHGLIYLWERFKVYYRLWPFSY